MNRDPSPDDKPWYVVVSELVAAGCTFHQAVDAYVVFCEDVHPGTWGRMRGCDDGKPVRESMRRARDALGDTRDEDLLEPDEDDVGDEVEATLQQTLEAVANGEVGET